MILTGCSLGSGILPELITLVREVGKGLELTNSHNWDFGHIFFFEACGLKMGERETPEDNTEQLLFLYFTLYPWALLPLLLASLCWYLAHIVIQVSLSCKAIGKLNGARVTALNGPYEESSRHSVQGECHIHAWFVKYFWIPWWLRWQRICLPCRKPGFNPWRRKWQPPHSLVILKIPWTEELGGSQSMGFQRAEHDWTLNTFHFLPRTVRWMK